jgi:hypothetical protein
VIDILGDIQAQLAKLDSPKLVFSGAAAFEAIRHLTASHSTSPNFMARERGLTVDTAGFEKLMEEQKQRAREAGKKNKQVVSVSEIETKAPTKFIGYDTLEAVPCACSKSSR